MKTNAEDMAIVSHNVSSNANNPTRPPLINEKFIGDSSKRCANPDQRMPFHTRRMVISEADYSADSPPVIVAVAGMFHADHIHKWKILTREELVTLLKDKVKVQTFSPDAEGNEQPEDVTLHMGKFITTKNNPTTYDNLGDLPIITHHPKK